MSDERSTAAFNYLQILLGTVGHLEVAIQNRVDEMYDLKEWWMRI